MGRIRTIKPEFFSDEDLSTVSTEAHLLAAALLCYVDDEGYFNANPGLVQAGTLVLRNFPEFSGVLAELARIDFVRLGKSPEGKSFGQVVHFTKHQRVSHPSPSKISPLGIIWDETPQALGKIPEDSVKAPQVLRPEGKGNREQGTGKGNREAPPALGPQPVPSKPIEPPDDFASDPAENIPDGLMPTQYAAFILQELHVAASYGLVVRTGDTIGMLASEEACGLPEATRRLLKRMGDAQAAGPVKWAFWLEDGNWKAPAVFSIGIEDEA